jgi:hypothetical protein
MWCADVATLKGSPSPGARGRWADACRRFSTVYSVGRHCIANIDGYRHNLISNVHGHRYRYGFAFLLLAVIVGPNLYGFAILYGGGYLTVWHGNRSAIRHFASRCDRRLFAGGRAGRLTARGNSRERLG